ncbi:NUDIX domain-containing protein, partial [Kitasatospora sp. MAP5-34]|uniref:NUDIX hydrolase n=1 Tax=Kitasatospora sp. MAP5-34 TaxID=3035102 RepID=UPI002476F294
TADSCPRSARAPRRTVTPAPLTSTFEDGEASLRENVRSRVSAYAIATTQDQVLLTQLSEASPIFAPGLWHLPGGGIDPGEQPVEALARELHEETGLDLLGARLVDARTYTARRFGVSWHLVGLFYVVALKPGSLMVTEVDGATHAAAWMPLSGLDDTTLSPAAIDGLGMINV